MRWTETGDAASITIDVDAIDADRQEAVEMARFVQESRTRRKPAPPQLSRGATIARRAISIALKVLGLFVGLPLFIVLVTSAPELVKGFGVAAAVFAVSWLIDWVLRMRKPADVTKERFTLSLDQSGFRLKASRRPELTVPLHDVHGFDGGRRLSLVRADGSPLALPCDLGAPADNEALAARLAEALVSVRASAGGYRGGPVRIALSCAPAGPVLDVDDTEPATESALLKAERRF